MAEKKKAKTTVGLFAGILNRDTGKLLLVRRVAENSIIPGTSFKGNWELPGGAVMEAETVSYDYLVKQFKQRLREKIGWTLESFISKMPAMYPVFFNGPEGYDLALVMVLKTFIKKISLAETCWVDTNELEKLASEFVPADKKKGKNGEGLLSGYGKRMHCMALKALCFSPSEKYAGQAGQTLEKIQATW